MMSEVMTARLSSMEDVHREIAEALGEWRGHFDIAGIAHECYEYTVDYDADGRGLANSAGFECTVSDSEFWAIAERYDDGVAHSGDCGCSDF